MYFRILTTWHTAALCVLEGCGWREGEESQQPRARRALSWGGRALRTWGFMRQDSMVTQSVGSQVSLHKVGHGQRPLMLGLSEPPGLLDKPTRLVWASVL